MKQLLICVISPYFLACPSKVFAWLRMSNSALSNPPSNLCIDSASIFCFSYSTSNEASSSIAGRTPANIVMLLTTTAAAKMIAAIFLIALTPHSFILSITIRRFREIENSILLIKYAIQPSKSPVKKTNQSASTDYIVKCWGNLGKHSFFARGI